MPLDAAVTELLQDAAGIELQQDTLPPSLPPNVPQPTFATSTGDILANPVADPPVADPPVAEISAATTANAGISTAAENPDHSNAASSTAATSSVLPTNEVVPQDPVLIAAADASADRAALAAPSPEIGRQSSPMAA
jgi:hypothetical protein